MPPTPEPTPEQLEQTREAARLPSLPYVTTLVNRLTDEQWAAMLLTLAAWAESRHDDVKLGGRVQIDPEKQRELLTDEVRIRLGLAPMFSLESSGWPASGSSRTEVVW
jgi:hypothetical protein